MRATQLLHNLGQSLWLDNITRELLDSGTLKHYIDDLSVTGLTSNPTIFDHAITHSNSYDSEIRRLVGNGLSGEELFFELAVQDLRRAADLFAPIHERTAGVDGWVSLEVSPLLAYDSKATVAEAKALHQKAGRRNLFIKIPGTREGVGRDRRCDFSGYTGERDPTFHARPLPGRGRGLYARIGAAGRCWSDPRRPFSSVAFRQPLGQGDNGESARLGSRQAGSRHRPAGLRGIPRSARVGSLATTG